MEKKKENRRPSLIVSLMCLAVLLIIELYLMTNMAWNVIALVIVTMMFLTSAYFFGNAIVKELQENKLRVEEQYDAITRANKASYILLKKAYEQLEEIENRSKTPTEEIITAQKAIAKVTISRNKENTDAMMNSNDKVLEKIFDFEENFGNNQNELLGKQKIMIDDSMKELMMKQQEMASSMKAMEESLKNELLQAMSSMQTVQAQTAAMAEEFKMPTESFTAEEPVAFDFGLEEEAAFDESLDFAEDLGLSEEMDFVEDLGLGEETDFAEDLGVAEEVAIDNFDLGVSEELSLEDMGISEDMDFTADLGLSEEMGLSGDLGLEENLGLSEEMSFGEDLGFSEDLGLSEEVSIDSDLDLGLEFLQLDEPVEEFVAEEIMEEPVAEPVAEEKGGFDMDLSNPNKMMTPEEIAALLEKM